MIEINGVPIEDLTVEKLTDVIFDIECEIDKKEKRVDNQARGRAGRQALTDWIENAE